MPLEVAPPGAAEGLTVLFRPRRVAPTVPYPRRQHQPQAEAQTSSTTQPGGFLEVLADEAVLRFPPGVPEALVPIVAALTDSERRRALAAAGLACVKELEVTLAERS